MSNASFLPEDYVEVKAERRTNLICLSLFGVVMIAVFAAFLVTNRQWTQVKSAQATINDSYQEAAQRIEQLNELQSQKEQMLSKAELATALIERVPRSILMAELINRMPPRLSLLELELKSERVKTMTGAVGKSSGTRRLKGAQRAKTRQEAAEEAAKVEAPRYVVSIRLIGVAPTDLEVSRFIGALNAYSLLTDVTLDYSEQTEMEDEEMRRFGVNMKLDPTADVRDVKPLQRPRNLANVMSDALEIQTNDTASVPTDGGGN